NGRRNRRNSRVPGSRTRAFSAPDPKSYRSAPGQWPVGAPAERRSALCWVQAATPIHLPTTSPDTIPDSDSIVIAAGLGEGFSAMDAKCGASDLTIEVELAQMLLP